MGVAIKNAAWNAAGVLSFHYIRIPCNLQGGARGRPAQKGAKKAPAHRLANHVPGRCYLIGVIASYPFVDRPLHNRLFAYTHLFQLGKRGGRCGVRKGSAGQNESGGCFGPVGLLGYGSAKVFESFQNGKSCVSAFPETAPGKFCHSLSFRLPSVVMRCTA